MTTLWLLDARDRTETNPRKISLDDNRPMAHDRQDLIKQLVHYADHSFNIFEFLRSFSI
jgi:hypothetical protein